MEKFAVDLEKVLDEFEYNEEREENVSAPSLRNPPLPAVGIGALRQAPPVRPPAASYRRPSFEPINLADADFAASPPKPSTLNFNLGASVTGKQNKDETFGYVNNKTQVNNNNYANADNILVSTINSETNIRNRIISDSEETAKVWPNPHSSLTNDEKPDLLEYNSKNVDFETNILDTHNQLPDITTSVRTLDSHEEETVPNSLDLISSTSGNFLIENGETTQNINCESCGGEKYSRPEKEFDESSNKFQCIKHSDETSSEASEHEESISNTTLEEVPKQEETKSYMAVEDVDSQDISYNYSSIPVNLSSGKIVNNVCETAELNNDNIQPVLELKGQSHSTNEKLCISNEEKTAEEEFQSDVSNDRWESHVVSDAVKPIGFNNDSDVSEGELEEYLKELEEMDESVDVKEKIVAEEITKEIEVEFTGKSEDSGKPLTENGFSVTTIGQGSLNYISEDISNIVKSKSKECEDELSSVHAHSGVVSSDFYGLDGKTPTLESIKNIKDESPVCQSDDLDTSSSSTPLISENESMCEDSHKTQNQDLSMAKPENIKVDSKENLVKVEDSPELVEGSKHKYAKINTNPFFGTDSTEGAVVHEEKDTRGSESTNPFDDEDSGYVSEKIESKRKSTNPFEDDNDEDVSVENSVSQNPAIASNSKTFPTDLPITLSKSESEKPDQDRVDNIINSAILVSMPVTPALDKLNSTVKSESTLETDFKPKTADEGSAKIASSVEEKATDKSIPGCSNAHEEYKSKTLESSAKMIPIKAAVESPSAENVDEAGVPAEEDRPLRPNSLELPKKITVEASLPQSPPPLSPPQSPNAGQLVREFGPEDRRLGKIAPFWVPDTDAMSCMQCQQKFTVIKRRHHCRACGQVLCYKCCGLKARLEYMNFAEARVCQPCFTILEALLASEASSPLGRQPNPNNPMEYCSTIPPLQQAAGSLHQPPPSVMVPVGVLKREGRVKSEVTKQVMFSDGIRPGGDLTELDGSCEPRLPFRRPGRLTKRVGTPPGGVVLHGSLRRSLDPTTHSFIPADSPTTLPPIVSRVQGEMTFSDLESPVGLDQPSVRFAINRNLFVVVKRVMLDCCVNRECWCFSTEGLACVGQDEIVFLLECLPEENQPPKDIFLLINHLYQEAAKGSTVSEMSFTPAPSNNLLGSKDHGGFLYIRTSYQCTARLVLPSPPYLVALLIHRWETPWARLFPLRLVLRLGAEFRYYPCPLVSVRNRPPLYTDIGHTIINILADFRKYSYTLPSVRGLVIHMEDRQTTINIPRNRYDQVVRALNNSNDSVLAFGANLSLAADSHLVCMQSTEDENTAYTTQAINIHNKPRKVTGASFVVFNGALKVPGLAGKSSIVEDGLMVQVPSETMVALRTALRDMRDYTIGCGPNAEETVALLWTADDTNFNIGVKSCIDGRSLDGVPSIRVHNGTDYSGGTRVIRWTEVFLLQCEDSDHSSEPLDISRLSESIACATCLALVPLLDLLSAASFSTLAVRTTIHPDNVGYEAGSNGEKLPPLYMKSLDEELIAVVHQAALASQDNPCVLELVFRIMEQG